MIGISQTPKAVNVSSINFRAKSEDVKSAVDMEEKPDTIEIQNKNNKKELTTKEKQETVSKARAKAAGWSVLFGVFSTLYYGLRSDKTIAKRFDLDKEKDQKLIKKIKRDQIIATLPAAVATPLAGIVAYIYCKNQNADKINVE